MKKFISIFFSLCLVVVLTLSASAESTNKLTYAVGASAPTVSANTEFTVLVEVTENTGICWLKATVTYDSSVLTYVSFATDSSVFDKNSISVNGSVNGNQGKLTVVLGSFNVFGESSPKMYTQTGTFVALKFKVAANAANGTTTKINVSTANGDALWKKNGVTNFDYTIGNASYDVKISDGTHTCTPAAAVKENEVAATCFSDGSYDKVVYCSGCGTQMSREKVVVAKTNDHSPAAAITENIVPPTCTKTGSYDEVVKCIFCKAELSRKQIVTDKSEHTKGESLIENLVDSTCSVEGSYELVTFCSVCKGEMTREKTLIGKASHTPGAVKRENVVEATCTKTGSYVEVLTCSVCNIEYSRETKIVEKTEHVLGGSKKENVVAETCIKNGSYDLVGLCAICNTEMTRVLVTTDKGDHIMDKAVVENRKEPANCSADGTYDSVIYCKVCKTELSRVTQSIAAPKHTPGPAATATSPQICTVCNKILTPKLDHVHSWSSSWATDGVGHWHTCSGCDDKKDYEAHHFTNGCDTDCNICGATRSVAGHQYDNDCDETCNKCGGTRVVVGHVYDNACDAYCNTCNAWRDASHTYDNACDADCNVCGAKRTPGDHVYGNWTVIKEAAAGVEGQRERACMICGKKITETIPALPPETTTTPDTTTPSQTEAPAVTTDPSDTTKEEEPATTSPDVSVDVEPGTTSPDGTTEPAVEDPGCGSVVSVGIAIIAILGTALIMKKRD